MRNSRFSNYGFLTLGPGQTITIAGSEGIKALNIYNPSTSTGNCTVTGKADMTLGGIACNNIAITPGAPAFDINTAMDEYDEDIDSVTIATATGCTVLITAMKKLTKMPVGFKGGGSGGGGSTFPFGGIFTNYSALPAAALNPSTLFYCSQSQGIKWLPGSLGGTYYPLGWYFSDGVSYTYQETPFQASQVTVDAGTNNDQFVTPLTLTNSAQLLAKQNTSEKGQANGYASLGADGKVPVAQLPGAIVTGTDNNIVIIANNQAVDSGLPYSLILASL